MSVFFLIVLALRRGKVIICWRGKKFKNKGKALVGNNEKAAHLYALVEICAPKFILGLLPEGKKITDFCVPYQKKKEKKKIQILSCQFETLQKWHFLTHSVEERQVLWPHCPQGDMVLGAGLPRLSPEGFTGRFPFLLNLCTPWVCSKRPGCLGDFSDLLAPGWATRLLGKKKNHCCLQRDN